MKKLIVIAALVSLVGCMKEPDVGPGQPYGTEYTSVTELGIMMRTDGTAVPLVAEDVDRIYSGVQRCMEGFFDVEITAHPEDILLVATDADVNDNYGPDVTWAIEGVTYIMSHGTPHIVIAVNSPEGEERFVRQLLSHEYVHALAPEFGISKEASHNHTDPVFAQCGYMLY